MTADQRTPSYTVVYDDRGTYLHASVSGAVDTVATSLAYWKEIAEECRARGHRKLLVIENLASAAPIMDVFEVAGKLPEILRGLKVAFVDSQPEQFEANKFGETVAVNRGAFGQVFHDEASAAAWLER